MRLKKFLRRRPKDKYSRQFRVVAAGAIVLDQQRINIAALERPTLQGSRPKAGGLSPGGRGAKKYPLFAAKQLADVLREGCDLEVALSGANVFLHPQHD